MKKTKETSQSNCKICIPICDNIANFFNNLKTKYNSSDEETKKKMILSAGGIAILFSGLLKSISKRKK